MNIVIERSWKICENFVQDLPISSIDFQQEEIINDHFYSSMYSLSMFKYFLTKYIREEGKDSY